ncbi:hypothetical protein RGQ29_025456 [Quercus rubra]|uniref:CASP-like protein n=1 Tax=Quercus rubra TaxID=3512 RepID=A0AAN7EYX6_QUERU|nr:hypothetical protein RGQ29_025456 [Quercus rubra]
MTNNDHASNQHVGSLPTIPTATPPVDNLENQSSVMGVESSTIVHRCKREDLIKKFSLALRGLALIFSVIALIIMAINKHSGWQDFDKYREYRYVLAIAILSTVYTGGQVMRQAYELCTGKLLLQQRS